MIRVLLIADVRFYREALAHALTGDGRFVVVDAIAQRDDPQAVADALAPDIVLLDATLPHAIELATRLSQRVRGEVKVIALGMVESENSVVTWAEAGACGYVRCDASFEQLTQVVVDCARGEFRCAPHYAASLLRRVAELSTSGLTDAQHAAWNQLTRRERDILQLIGRGLSNKEIASELGIELPTAKNHVHRVFEKLNLHRRADVIVWMQRRMPEWDSRTPPSEPGAGARSVGYLAG
jgi:DNA-binding NarL/FixJ family response regulator